MRPSAPPSRRRFLQGSLALTGLGLLAGCGLVQPRTQGPARIPRVGALFPFALPAQGFSPPFHDGLREYGYVVGETIQVEYRSSDGDAERLPELAAELASLPVDVLVTFGGTPAALAAMRATGTVPIVVLLVGDPVGAGLVTSHARPGGNLTGITNFSPETSAKRLDLLREVVLGLARVDFLWNPANPTSLLDWQETQAAARTLGLQPRSVGARTPDEVTSALAAIAANRPDAVIKTGEPVLTQQRAQVLEFLANQRLPAIHQWRDDVAQGGLMAYGVNGGDVVRRGAYFVDRIIKGAKPAELPVERPTTFDFVINHKTAQALGLSISPTVLQQATEVI